jgi:DNA invertase Pin-like site-specific DNA recombinase
MRAAIYTRVSTSEQTTKNQELSLVEVAERRGWTLIRVYEDFAISGGKGRDRRPALNEMLQDATRRRFDVLLIAAVDRLGRSVAQVAGALSDMQAAGVVVYAHREGMDGTTSYGRAMLGMAAVFAELEKELIRDRVRAGLARARAEGKRLGRPPTSSVVKARIRQLRGDGNSFRATARAADVAVATVQIVLRESVT